MEATQQGMLSMVVAIVPSVSKKSIVSNTQDRPRSRELYSLELIITYVSYRSKLEQENLVFGWM